MRDETQPENDDPYGVLFQRLDGASTLALIRARPPQRELGAFMRLVDGSQRQQRDRTIAPGPRMVEVMEAVVAEDEARLVLVEVELERWVGTWGRDGCRQAVEALDGTGLKALVEGMPSAWLGNVDVFNRQALTVYWFSMTKHGSDLADKLHGFGDTVLCDAESRHNELFTMGRPEANCNAHPRRKFRDAEKAQPILAAKAGAFHTEMYDVEGRARQQGLTGEALLALRQAETRPIVERFKA